MNSWRPELATKAKNYVVSNSLLRRIALLVLDTPTIANNPIYRYAYQRQISHVINVCSEKPQVVQLEVTNACNLHCINCPHRDMRRRIGFMEMEIYKKVIDECVKLEVDDIYLSGIGEPTLHKSLVDMVAYAKTSKVARLALYTNATLLTPQLSEGLIERGLDELYVSVDAATNETYNKLRPPSRLAVVEDNLRNLIKLRNEMKSTKPQVTVKFIKKPENVGEMRLFKRKWRGLADEIYIGFAHNWGGAIDGGKSEWQGNVKRNPCTMIFRFLNILWDGRVSLCCLDSEGEVILGDVKETSVKETWCSKRLQEIRQAHLDGNFDKTPLCDKCSFRDVWWLY